MLLCGLRAVEFQMTTGDLVRIEALPGLDEDGNTGTSNLFPNATTVMRCDCCSDMD